MSIKQAQFVDNPMTIDYQPDAPVAAGTVVVLGSLIAVARKAIAANAIGQLTISGEFDVSKVNTEIPGGSAVYWDADGSPIAGFPSSGAATTETPDNTFMGYAVRPAGAAEPTVRLCLAQTPVPTTIVYNPLLRVIDDPGDAGVIPVDGSGRVDLVTAAAETRSLAVPTAAGLQMLVTLQSDGGDCVLTVEGGVLPSGENTVTFDDEGDSILLVSVASGAGFVWRCVLNAGCTLTTV